MGVLDKKRALVTGASRGIGRAIALALASEGAEVIVNYATNAEKAQEVCAEIEKMGGKCRAVQADLRDLHCADSIAAQVPEVDILVLNASIQYRKNWQEITPQEFEDQVNCNLRASLLLVQKYAPGMIARGFGRVVTVGSVQEIKPQLEMMVYSATKAALTRMAKSFALQFAGTGVTVNSIAPGVIETDRNTEALANAAYKAEILSKIPVGFLGQSYDCAGIVKFLCTEEARYITGQNIFVDGGMGIQ